MDPLSVSAILPHQSRELHGSNSKYVLLAESTPFPLQACDLPFQLYLSLLTLRQNCYPPTPCKTMCFAKFQGL